MAHSGRSAIDVLRTTVKWGAQVSGAASFVVLALFVVSHAGAGEFKPDAVEAVGLLCFPGGVMVGLALAFRFNKSGALMAIISCAAFYVWHFTRSGDFPHGIYFVLFTSPAVLFLISGLFRERQTPSEDLAI